MPRRPVRNGPARFAAPGLNNSILWQGGHALIVVEHLGVSAATGKPPVYPADWFEKFSWQSKPATVTSGMLICMRLTTHGVCLALGRGPITPMIVGVTWPELDRLHAITCALTSSVVV